MMTTLMQEEEKRKRKKKEETRHENGKSITTYRYNESSLLPCSPPLALQFHHPPFDFLESQWMGANCMWVHAKKTRTKDKGKVI